MNIWKGCQMPQLMSKSVCELCNGFGKTRIVPMSWIALFAEESLTFDDMRGDIPMDWVDCDHQLEGEYVLGHPTHVLQPFPCGYPGERALIDWLLKHGIETRGYVAQPRAG